MHNIEHRELGLKNCNKYPQKKHTYLIKSIVVEYILQRRRYVSEVESRVNTP